DPLRELDGLLEPLGPRPEPDEALDLHDASLACRTEGPPHLERAEQRGRADAHGAPEREQQEDDQDERRPRSAPARRGDLAPRSGAGEDIARWWRHRRPVRDSTRARA